MKINSTPINFRKIFILLSLFLYGTIFSQVDLSGITLNFRNANKTILVNNGSNGSSVGSVHKYSNLVTKGALVIYGKLTITGMTNGMTIATFDDDASNIERFQPQLTNPNSNTGLVTYKLELFDTSTNLPVSIQNFSLGGVDLDGSATNKREIYQIEGFSNYQLDSSTLLTISTIGTKTQISGRTTELTGISFDATASFIANYLVPTNTIVFSMGAIGDMSSRQYSLQIGIPTGSFPNPVYNIDALNDVSPLIINGALGGIAFTNILSNDKLINSSNPNGIPVVLNDLNLSFVSASHPNISLNGTNVTVGPNTPAGDYTLRYKICQKSLPNNCDEADVIIKVGLLTLNVAPNQIKCFGEKGSVVLTTTGGNAPYTFSGAATTNLLPGNYSYTVTDANNWTDTKSVTISQPTAALFASVGSVQNVNCRGAATGSATASATGGTATYSYSWNTTPVQTSSTATGLAAGTYTITVTDSKGCTDTEQVTIGQPATALALAVSAKTDASCFGSSTGSVTAGAVSGAVGAVTYTWKNAAGTVVGSSASVSNLPAGTYTLTVTDTCSSQSNSVTIGQPATALVLAVSAKTDASCFGSSTGSVTAGAVSGAVGAVTYSWKNAAGTVVGSSASVSNLPAGIYTLTVADTCSSQSNSVTIGQPAAFVSATAIIVNNNNCAGCSNGSIDVTVTGGTTPYSYSWTNGAFTEDISNLPNGSYGIEITDKKGCKANYVYMISESGISITKDGTYVDINNDGVTNAGDVVSYNFIIKNTGNVSLTNVTVTDNNATITGGPIASLAVGATDATTFSGTHIITQADINTAYVYNIATVSGKDPDDKSVTDISTDPTPCTSCPKDPECTDCTITELNQSPSINITKDGTYVDTNNDGVTNAGDVVSYNFVINNTGNVPLTNVT
ncbi:MAG: DUF7507 domain-containing protein, partial [Flavobacterium sp.]